MTDLTPDLVAYLDTRQQQRARRADVAWSTLRPYERRLVREAAVMAYVLAYEAGNLDGRTGHGGPLDDTQRLPHDVDIVRTVLQHCDSTSDIYPYLAAACAGRRRRVTKKRMWPGEAAAIDHITSEEN